jgi:Porin subfamily
MLGYSETGHPGDKWGWVVAGGLRLNFPMIAQGDYFQTQVNYTHGALRYMNQGNYAPNYAIERGGSLGFGVLSDCVYGSNGVVAAGALLPTGCSLTTAWGIIASYEHYWTPQFHESFIGGYMQVRYNTQANNILCVAELQGNGIGGAGALAAAGCNNNFDIWSVATRLQYDFTKTLYIGVEFVYNHLDTATLPGGVLGASAGSALPPPQNDLNSATQIKDQNNLAVTLRVHKDFLP